MILRRFFILLISLLGFILTSAPALAKNPEAPAAAVQVVTAKQQTWQPSVDAVGTLIASQGTMIEPEIAGRIVKIHFKSGLPVKVGDPLVQLNPDVLTAQLAALQAKLQLNKLAFNRALRLYKQQAVSKAEYDLAVANYKSSKADVDSAQAQLDLTLIRAPFSGLLGLRLVSIGDYVDAGMALVNLQAITPMYVDFSIPEVYLSELKTGETITITSQAFPDKTFRGRVFAFDSVIDAETRSLAARATIPNENGFLKPGAFVNVELELGQPVTVFQIPQTAVLAAPEGDFVYIVKNNKAVKTPITIYKRLSDTVLISKGLKNNDVVITVGQIKVQPNGPVDILKSP